MQELITSDERFFQVEADELSTPEKYVVIVREVLRVIGLTGTKYIQIHEDDEVYSSEDDTFLLHLLRSVIIVTSTNNPDAAFFSNQSLQQVYASISDRFFRSAAPNKSAANLVNVLSFALTAKSAVAFSASEDEEQLVSRAVNSLYELSNAFERGKLRYGYSDGYIPVPPADRRFAIPLWADDECQPCEPDNWSEEWRPSSSMIRLPSVFGSRPTWSFWREWYQGFLDGKPMDWELQRRVAMIPDVDWEKGPEHIAWVIEDIRTRFALEQRLAELESEISTLTERNRHSIGGNNPPEEIAQEEVIQEFLIEPVQELQTQVQAETPDKSRVRMAVEKLTALLVVAGKWTGSKLEMAVDECAKSIGKKAGTAIVAWITLNSEAITEIIRLAGAWLKFP